MAEEKPITHATTAANSAQTAIGARLAELFPNGVLPEPTPLKAGELTPGNPTYRPPQDAATGAPAATTGPSDAPTGTPAPTGPAAQPAESGATGPVATTGPSDAPTGPTDAPSGPAASGPTDAQLDAAGNKMDIKAGTAFKYVRDELATTKTKLAEAEKALKAKESATGPAGDPAEVAALKEKVARYENELAISKVEATDDFKKNISQPLAKANTDLRAIVDKYKVASSDFEAALAVADPIARTDKLAELSAEFNRLDLVRFDQLIAKIDQLSEQKQTTIAMAADKWKALQSKADADAQAAASAFEANWKGALQTAAIKLDKDGFFKLTGDATRDAEINKMKQTVQNLDVAKLSNEDLADSLYKANAFPLLLNELSAALASVGERDATIAKLRGSTPAPAGNGQTPPPPPSPAGTVDPTASFAATMKEKLKGVLPG